MTVHIIIPFSSSDPNRIAAFDKVRAHLKELRWPILIGRDDHDPFRRAVAVNHAVAETDADVLLLNDADLICTHEQILTAISLAALAPGPVFAFTEYVRTGEPDKSSLTLHEPSTNGCLAIQRHSFLQLGGYDERFIGWGYEDCDFNDRARHKWPLRRVPGIAEHVWHGDRRADDSTLDTSEEQVAANWRLYHGRPAA